MKRFSLKILMLLCLLSAVCGFSGCTDDLGMGAEESSIPEGERIVLGFMPYGLEKSSARANHTDFESAVEKLNIFVFDAQGNIQHRQQIDFTDVLPNEGTLVLDKWRSEFTQGANYTIHLVANATDGFKPENIRTFTDLQNATEINSNIHLTAVEGEETLKYFVMYGSSGNVVLNPGGNQDTNVDIPLVREAAKIVLTLTEGKMKDENENETGEYFEFSRGVKFRFSNLQTETRYVYDANDLPDNPLKDTELTDLCVVNSADNTSPGSVTITTYAYPNSWEQERVNMTYLVVRLPYVNEDEVYVEDNFYSIPITGQTALEANHVYTIKATIDAAGSTSDYEPKTITGEYDVTTWVDKDIEIGDGLTPHYLFFDKNNLVMRGIETDSIGFSSSHELKVTLMEAYFYNKYGEKIDIKEDNAFNIKVNSNNDNEADISKLISEVVTWEDFHGDFIHIECPTPMNNLPQYIKCKVEHLNCNVTNCNLGTTITIEQYPTEYITSYFGWHSYRDDFIKITETPAEGLTPPESGTPCTYENISDEGFRDKGVVRLYYGPEVTVTGTGKNEVVKIDSAKLLWSYRSTNTYSKASGKSNSGSGFFKSKMAFQPEDTGYKDVFTQSKSAISQFFWQDDTLRVPVSAKNNPRIYQVNLTSTKKTPIQYGTWNGSGVELHDIDYDVTQPRLDENGYTDSSPDNLRLVSPAFAVASRLGAVSSTASKMIIEKNDGDKTGKTLSFITYLGKEEEYYQIAAEHCARYVEVYRQRDKDGALIDGAKDVVLDNWRLPTPAELRILIYYQDKENTNPDAMDYQLPGNYFWTADKHGPVYNWNHSGVYNADDVGLRCVHDMTNILNNAN